MNGYASIAGIRFLQTGDDGHLQRSIIYITRLDFAEPGSPINQPNGILLMGADSLRQTWHFPQAGFDPVGCQAVS